MPGTCSKAGHRLLGARATLGAEAGVGQQVDCPQEES